MATTIVIDTGACASVLGSGRDTRASLCMGLRSASFATSFGSRGEDPACHLAALCPNGRTRMTQRRSAWIDVFVPLPPELRQLGRHVSGGGSTALAHRTLFSLSLPPCLSLHRFFSPLAFFLLCVGASLPSFRLVVADPRRGAHHRKCGISTHTAVGEISWSVGLSWKTYSHRSSIVHCGRYLRSYHGLGIPRFCTDI